MILSLCIWVILLLVFTVLLLLYNTYFAFLNYTTYYNKKSKEGFIINYQYNIYLTKIHFVYNSSLSAYQ